MTTMVRSRDSKAVLAKAAGALAALILVIVFATPIAPYLRAFVANFFAPSSTDVELGALSKKALIERAASDEAKLSEINYQAALYGLLAQENAALRKAAHASSVPDALTVRVLSRPPQTLYDTFLVDQGTAAGVAEGNLAVYGGAALGRVVSASAGTALVQLFSSPGTEIDAILGSPQAIAVAKGMGGGAFELSVPQGVHVSAGDSVRISASQALLLGTVMGVSAKPTDASQTVYVRAPLSSADADFIEIIPNRI